MKLTFLDYKIRTNKKTKFQQGYIIADKALKTVLGDKARCVTALILEDGEIPSLEELSKIVRELSRFHEASAMANNIRKELEMSINGRKEDN